MKRFGGHIRKRREALKNRDPKRFSIRRLSERIGVQSGYLSRIERGKASALSEEKIKALALELGEDEDYLLALAGKVSDDVRAIIRDRPALFAKLIRGMKDLPDSAVEAESEYRKIERRLNQAQTVARIGSWERNFQTGETYWSEFMYEILGFASDGKPPGYEEVISRVHPEDREIFHDVTRPGEPGEVEEDCRFRVVRPGGSMMHVYARVKVERDDDGEPIRIIGCSQDVTEQVETRHALARSEALLRSVLESPELVIIFSLDRDYRYLMFNKAHADTMRAIWGVDIQAGMNMLDAIGDPDDRAKAKINFDRALAGEHFTMVEEYGDPGLARKFWEDNYSPIFDENGEIIGLTVILTDVTERVKTSRALAESERLWRTLAENIPGCDVFLFDRELRFLAAGGSEVERFGFSHEHFLGRTLHEALNPETAAMLEPHCLKPLRGEESRMEFDFAEASYLAHAVPVCDKQGRPYLGLGLVMNVTELKQAEHALQEAYVGLEQQVGERTRQLAQAKRELEEELLSRWTAEKALAESEARYRALAEQSPVSIMAFDAQGVVNFVNDWHLEVFAKGKLGADFFLGRKITQLPGLVSAGAAEKIGRILEGVALSIDELHIPVFPAGHEGWQSVHGVPLILEGRLAGGILIRQDITEQVRAKERMEQSLAEKETLLQEIHHRVKNNMQVVSGLMDMASRRVRSREARDALKDIQTKIRSMALIHSMIYRGERLDKVDFGSYVRKLYSELASMYSDTAARVRAEMNLESIYMPLNTAVPLSIVLNEALTNAFKHAFPKNRNGTIEISLQRRDGEILLKVADDGIGPASPFDLQTADSLGIRLIRDITRLQLKGNVDYDTDRGFSLELRLHDLNEDINAT